MVKEKISVVIWMADCYHDVINVTIGGIHGQSRLGLEAVRGFQEDVVPILKVEFVTADIHRAGLAALLSAGRRGLSLFFPAPFLCGFD